MTVSRLAGRAAGGSTGPRFVSDRWDGLVLVRGLGEDADPVPGGHDHRCPGPGGGDFEAEPAATARQAGGGVQDAVAQRFRLGAGEVAVQGEQPQPGEQGGGGQRGSEPRARLWDSWWLGNLPIPVSFPVRMAPSTRAYTLWAASM
jgi:hypothetical protein